MFAIRLILFLVGQVRFVIMEVGIALGFSLGVNTLGLVIVEAPLTQMSQPAYSQVVEFTTSGETLDATIGFEAPY